MFAHDRHEAPPRSAGAVNDALRFCFLTERQVGIGSAAAALEPYIRPRPNVVWGDVTYVDPSGLLERFNAPNRGMVRGFLQTGAALRRGPFDALFFLTHNPAVLRQRALAHTPALLWTDVTPALLDAQAEQYAHRVDRSRAVRFVKHTLVRRTFHRAALCVGWSDWARRSFVNDYGVPEANTAVVPPGIDLRLWPAPSAGASGRLPRVLFVGGHFTRKGGDLLLDVFRTQLKGRCELDLVTRDAIAQEPGVRVHRGLNAGTPELLALYAGADVFVLPTLGDCFSIAGIEAMAMGLPVIITSVGGIPEIVQEGQSGHLIAPGDGRALLAALTPLLDDPARRAAFGARGHALVEERFDASKTSERLIALLVGIASRGSANGGRR